MEYFYGGIHVTEYLDCRKKVLRIITLSKYNAHTDPLFKSLDLLKLYDILKVF